MYRMPDRLRCLEMYRVVLKKPITCHIFVSFVFCLGYYFFLPLILKYETVTLIDWIVYFSHNSKYFSRNSIEQSGLEILYLECGKTFSVRTNISDVVTLTLEFDLHF